MLPFDYVAWQRGADVVRPTLDARASPEASNASKAAEALSELVSNLAAQKQKQLVSTPDRLHPKLGLLV